MTTLIDEWFDLSKELLDQVIVKAKNDGVSSITIPFIDSIAEMNEKIKNHVLRQSIVIRVYYIY